MSNTSTTLPQRSFVSVSAAGLIALAIAMGVGRFAFTPMLPLMLRGSGADLATGSWLAAANYVGYLLGALTAARIPLAPERLGLLALGVIVASTASMGLTGSTPLWLGLRFVAGVASAWALVSTSVWCLAWLARFDRAIGPGLLYSGVGLGIALVGAYCWAAGALEVDPGVIWLHLGTMALMGLLCVAALMPQGACSEESAPASMAAAAAPAASAANPGGVPWGVVVCYGLLGFGYILPATFLPVLARAVVDDPAVFGAAWPVFGAAAAASTLLASVVLVRVARRHVLAGSYVAMAFGCLLPVLHLSAVTVLLSALLVGGTFMVATMAGMQEARARTAGDATRALGRMVTAFAIGQMAGPVLSAILSDGGEGFDGLFIALGVGAVTLLAGAWWLGKDR